MDKWDEEIDEDLRLYYEKRGKAALSSIKTANDNRALRVALTMMFVIAVIAIVLWRLGQ